MVMASSVFFFLLSLINHSSGWIATVMFFSTNVGSGVVMLFSSLLFTVVTVLMGLALISVSMTDWLFYTSLTTNHEYNYDQINTFLHLSTTDSPIWELQSELIIVVSIFVSINLRS